MKRNINRNLLALFYLFVSTAFSFALGGILFLIAPASFWNLVKAVFLLFAAPVAVAGLLLLVTKISDDYVYGYGAGLYYGTIGVVVVARWLELDVGTGTAFFFGAVITILTCYIIYHKCGHGNEDDS